VPKSTRDPPGSAQTTAHAVDAVLARSAAEAAADHLLRGADTLYVVMAHLLGLPLITLDSELRRRAAGLVRVVAP
jgi:predicted nucleic acid-binding protein